MQDRSKSLSKAETLASDVVAHRLGRALAYAGVDTPLQDIVAQIKEGRLQCFPAPDNSLVLTEVREYNSRKVMNILAAAGSLDGTLSTIPRMVAFGIDHGCEEISQVGRPGWVTILGRMGWQRDPRVRMFKRLAA